jgi:hypothetical protein
MNTEEKNTLSLINASGFLLQMALEHQVASTYNKEHDYELFVSEHPWDNLKTKEKGFVDIILQKNFVRLIIECKRPRGGEWVFLVPQNAKNNVQKSRFLWSRNRENNPSLSNVDEFLLTIASYESRICLIRGQGEEKLSLLERLSYQLISSIESIANEEILLSPNQSYPDPIVYLPVILTTATLKVATINLDKISLDDGTIDSAPYEIVPYIKFRKSLVTSLSPNRKPDSIVESNKDKERTILVVNTKEIINTLKNLDIITSRFSICPIFPWDKSIYKN